MIAVLDYGIGNLRSAQKGLERASGGDVEVRLATTADEARGATGVVLPGVGAFGRCMQALTGSGLDVVAKEAVAAGTPFLGVCIGMQLLFESSEEDPEVPGLGLLPGRIRLLPAEVKRPQMQWNQLELRHPADPLLVGIDDGSWVYFVHSYAATTATGLIAATTDYGGPMVAMVATENVWATQFHPEKSGAVGLRLLSNFVRVATTR
ncbi:MAG: imidazole glycerol phosphate synthase subunit HisH [Acidimicrobiales bacterium]